MVEMVRPSERPRRAAWEGISPSRQLRRVRCQPVPGGLDVFLDLLFEVHILCYFVSDIQIYDSLAELYTWQAAFADCLAVRGAVWNTTGTTLG